MICKLNQQKNFIYLFSLLINFVDISDINQFLLYFQSYQKRLDVNINLQQSGYKCQKVQQYIKYIKIETMQISQLTNPITVFQARIANLMVMLGSKEKQQILAHFDRPCLQSSVLLGQQMYIGFLRTKLVQKGYLSSQIPTKQHLKDYQKIINYRRNIQNQRNNSSYNTQNRKLQKKLETPKQKLQMPNKKGSKKDQKYAKLRKQQLQKNLRQQKFEKELDYILNTKQKQSLQTNFSFIQKILQVKLSTFLYIRYFIDQKYQTGKITNEDVFQCISVLLKIISKFRKFRGKRFILQNSKQENSQKQQIQISQTLILDLKLASLYLIEQYQYSNFQILFNYPRLSYDNRYNKYFPCFDNKPYSSQFQLIQSLKSSINKQQGAIICPKFILNRTMVGAGKTSIVLSIAKFIQKVNRQANKKGKNRLKVIYACQINSVRTQLARVCYNTNVNFKSTKKNTIIRGDKRWSYVQLLKISKNNNNQQQFDLIICDWEIAHQLLSKRCFSKEDLQIFQKQNTDKRKEIQIGLVHPQNAVLFIDEPTFECNSYVYQKSQMLLKTLSENPPKITIFASATMPAKQQIPKTLSLVSNHFPNILIEQVKSKQFQIGCQFKNFAGQTYYPHKRVKNKEQLKLVIKKIQQIPYLMKLYSGRAIYKLIQKFDEHNLKYNEQIDIDGFSTSLQYQDFPRIAVNLLTALLQYQDHIIEQICNAKYDNNQNTNINKQNQWQEDDDDDQVQKSRILIQDKQDYAINFKKIINYDAYKFLGGCLIATIDPISFVKKYFRKWVKDIPSIKKITNNYTDYQNNLAIPSYKKINTEPHYQKYYLNETAQKPSLSEYRVHKSKLITDVSLNSIQQLGVKQVDQTLMKLLLCGVAVYTQPHFNVSPYYLAKVQQLASLNQLAFIVSDRSLCFGVNFPISNVILCDDIAQTLSFNEIFQLTGRAGRVGKSWTANAYIQQNTEQRFIDFVLGQEWKTGNQEVVLQQIAQQVIRNSEVKLRTVKTQIKCQENQENEVTIKINVNQGDRREGFQFQSEQRSQERSSISNKFEVQENDEQVIKINSVIVHLSSTCGTQSQNKFFQEYRCLPISYLKYQDIPVIAQENQCIIDKQVQQKQQKVNNNQIYGVDRKAFYRNQQEFICRIIESCTKRTIFEDLGLGNQLFKIKILNRIFADYQEPKICQNQKRQISFAKAILQQQNYSRQTKSYIVYANIIQDQPRQSLSDDHQKQTQQLQLDTLF